METIFFQSFRVNIREKSQLFKIYMKKSQNDTIPYTNVGITQDIYDLTPISSSRAESRHVSWPTYRPDYMWHMITMTTLLSW